MFRADLRLRSHDTEGERTRQSAVSVSNWASLPTERSVEIPWLLSQNVVRPALDVGCNESAYLRHYSDALAPLDGIDVRYQQRGGLETFFCADIRTWEAPQKYATVIALSTIEHIGLACYGYEADDVEYGDRRAVEGCMRALRPEGRLLMTVPFGDTFENRGWYRVYSPEALDILLDGFSYQVETRFDPTWDVGGVALVTAFAQ